MPLLLNLLPARFLLTLREWFDYKISHCVLTSKDHKAQGKYDQNTEREESSACFGPNKLSLPWSFGNPSWPYLGEKELAVWPYLQLLVSWDLTRLPLLMT